MKHQEINLCPCRICGKNPDLQMQDLRKYVLTVRCATCWISIMSPGLNIGDSLLVPLIAVINSWNDFNKD